MVTAGPLTLCSLAIFGIAACVEGGDSARCSDVASAPAPSAIAPRSAVYAEIVATPAQRKGCRIYPDESQALRECPLLLRAELFPWLSTLRAAQRRAQQRHDREYVVELPHGNVLVRDAGGEAFYLSNGAEP